jgi:hypothetical protein
MTITAGVSFAPISSMLIFAVALTWAVASSVIFGHGSRLLTSRDQGPGLVRLTPVQGRMTSGTCIQPWAWTIADLAVATSQAARNWALRWRCGEVSSRESCGIRADGDNLKYIRRGRGLTFAKRAECQYVMEALGDLPLRVASSG